MENEKRRSAITVFEDGSAFYKDPPYVVRVALTILTGWPQKPNEEERQTALKTITEWESEMLQRRKEKVWKKSVSEK